jgi:hypothetical protein
MDDVFESLKHTEMPEGEFEYVNFPWNKGKAGTYTNGPHSKERKEAISMALKGNVPWNKGKKTGPVSDETKRKMSESHKGKEPWNKGIKTPEEIAERKKAYRKAYYERTKK